MSIWYRGPDNWINHIKQKLVGISVDYDSILLVDYSEKNEDYYFLSPDLLSGNVRLMSSEELDCFISFENSEWEKYYQKYPDSVGLFKFTRPRLNAQGDRAIVEYSRYRASNAATGYLVILEKINGVWTVTDRIDLWVA